MYTRCPECHTVYPLSAAELSRGGGRVTCGRCQKNFNAHGALFDHWPEPGERPDHQADETQTVELSHRFDELPDPDEPLAESARTQTPGRKNMAWIAALVILFAITAIHIIWTFWSPTQSAENMGNKTGLPTDAASIELASRQMVPHEELERVMVLSAVLVNRGNISVAYPVVEVILFDSEQQIIAHRKFQAAEYLSENSNESMGLKPGLLLPISLEFQYPEGEASGYEINFH